MIGARSVHFDRELRAADAGELFGVNSRHEAARARGGKNAPRLRHRERAAIAENIAEFGEARRRHCRNPAFHQHVHVGIGPAGEIPAAQRARRERSSRCRAAGPGATVRGHRGFSARSSNRGRSRFWPRAWSCRAPRIRGGTQARALRAASAIARDAGLRPSCECRRPSARSVRMSFRKCAVRIRPRGLREKSDECVNRRNPGARRGRRG